MNGISEKEFFKFPFEDRANGYAIGDYKERSNMIGIYQTVRPENDFM